MYPVHVCVYLCMYVQLHCTCTCIFKCACVVYSSVSKYHKRLMTKMSIYFVVPCIVLSACLHVCLFVCMYVCMSVCVFCKCIPCLGSVMCVGRVCVYSHWFTLIGWGVSIFRHCGLCLNIAHFLNECSQWILFTQPLINTVILEHMHWPHLIDTNWG